MSIYNILSPNNLNLFCESQTVKKIKIANTSDGVAYTQQLQNKNGTIALLSDVSDTQNYYASLTKNSPSANTTIVLPDGNPYLLNIVSDLTSVTTLSNFEKVTAGVPAQVTGLKYIGTSTKKFRITFSCSLAGSNQYINTLRLYKNDSPLDYYANATTYSLSEANIIILDCILELATNDILSLYIKSTASIDLDVFCPSFQIISV